MLIFRVALTPQPPLPTASLGEGSHAKYGDFRGLKVPLLWDRDLG
jgi:hypothetical protein